MALKAGAHAFGPLWLAPVALGGKRELCHAERKRFYTCPGEMSVRSGTKLLRRADPAE